MSEVLIENVVGSGGLDTELDLRELADNLKTSVHRYDPEVHPGLYVKFNAESPMVTLYRTGRYNISGAKSIEKIEKTQEQLLETLDGLGVRYEAENEPLTIRNLVCVTDLEERLDLNRLAIELGLENVEYEPEQFPGLVFRPSSRAGVYLLFASGKVVITGLTDLEDVKDGAEKLQNEVITIVR